MGLWIKDSELDVFRIEGVDARFYLRRISRAAMLKAQDIASQSSLGSLPADMLKPTREQRELSAEQRAEHDAKPLAERIEAELDVAYAQHDRKTVLDYGLVKVVEGDGETERTTEGLNWIEDMDGEVAERIFRELVSRNAVLPSRLKA